LAGKDLKGGGTWLGITEKGRFGALTNYRDPTGVDLSAPTRGSIVIDYLTGKDSAVSYLYQLAESNVPYNKFSVILGTMDELYYFTNATKKYQKIEKGIHGLCNHLLDTPWPKVVKGKNKLRELLKIRGVIDTDRLMALLANNEIAPEDLLPDTGVDEEFEKVLSPIFIKSPTYGTRCSTVLLIDIKGNVTFIEKNYLLPGTRESLQKFQFSIKAAK